MKSRLNEDLDAVPVDVSAAVVAMGRAVVAMPCENPALSPTLDVIGFPGEGWYLRVTDAYSTKLWSIMLQGRADDVPAAH